MEALRFAAVLLVFVLVQVFGVLGSPLSGEEDGGDMWTVDTWQDLPQERELSLRLADFIKRSKSQQFHGLMGRSTGVTQPVRLGRKSESRRHNRGNKGEMFVGLMGRRSLGGDIEEEWSPYFG